MSVATKSQRIIATIFNKKFKSTNKFLLNKYVDITKLHSRSIYTSSLVLKNISFNLSDIGEGIREVAVKEWFVKVGDKVSQFDNICEVQSDKASVTITSRYDGVIKKLYYAIDETALVGKPLIDIETEDDDDSSSSDSDNEKIVEPKVTEKVITEKNVTKKETEPISYKKEICIPSVRRLAKEHNIDLSLIQGTGKDNRILKEDVLKYLDGTKDTTVKASKAVSDKTVPIKGFQKAMVKTMTESLKIPAFVYSDEIAVTKLSEMRKSIKEECLKSGVKISYMPFIIKAASNALLKYPVLNSSVDENCENITYKGSHNIGVAMDTKVGLAVPVIKNVQDLTIMEIAKELNRLMLSGKQGNFSTNDLVGGTFSISNIGVIGGTYTKPVILSPQVAIIALGASRILPRFDSEMNVVPEEIVSLSGAADHRVVDGATMANFVNLLKKQIENPYLLFLNL